MVTVALSGLVTTNIIIIFLSIVFYNPLKNMCDSPFVLLQYLDLQAFMQQTGIKVQENVIPDSFSSIVFGGLFFFSPG